MKELPFISFVIPTWRESKILKACLNSLLNQDYPKEKFEIILVSKKKLNVKKEGVQLLQIDEEINHAQARNIGVKKAKGELIAFIDDDCILPSDWLLKASRFFVKPNSLGLRNANQIALIGGSALPPKDQSIRYRLGGYLSSSIFVIGFASSRHKCLSKIKEAREYELILANNLLRKDIFLNLGGFDPDQVPCEENDLYLRIKKAGYKLIYAPGIFVWHRAKPIFFPWAKKIFFYATGRGLLLARRPKNLRLRYIIPSTFLMGLFLLSVLSFFSKEFFYLLIGILFVYILGNIINAFYIFFKFEKNPLVLLFSPPATFLIHSSYGLGVLFGIYKYISGSFKGGIKMKSKY